MRKQPQHQTYSNKVFRHPVFNDRFIGYDLNGNRQIFNTESEAREHSETGFPLSEYRGFHYSYPGRVFRNGIHIFTNHLFESFQDAKKFIDKSLRLKELTTFEERQLNRYGNVLEFSDEFEDGSEAAQRSADWMNEQAEQLLFEHQ